MGTSKKKKKEIQEYTDSEESDHSDIDDRKRSKSRSGSKSKKEKKSKKSKSSSKKSKKGKKSKYDDSEYDSEEDHYEKQSSEEEEELQKELAKHDRVEFFKQSKSFLTAKEKKEKKFLENKYKRDLKKFDIREDTHISNGIVSGRTVTSAEKLPCLGIFGFAMFLLLVETQTKSVGYKYFQPMDGQGYFCGFNNTLLKIPGNFPDYQGMGMMMLNEEQELDQEEEDEDEEPLPDSLDELQDQIEEDPLLEMDTFDDLVHNTRIPSKLVNKDQSKWKWLYFPYLIGKPQKIIDRAVCVSKCPKPSMQQIACSTKDYFICENDMILEKIYKPVKYHRICYPDVHQLIQQGRNLEAHDWLKTWDYIQKQTTPYMTLLDAFMSKTPIFKSSIASWFVSIYIVTTLGFLGQGAAKCMIILLYIVLLTQVLMYQLQTFFITNNMDTTLKWEMPYGRQDATLAEYHTESMKYLGYVLAMSLVLIVIRKKMALLYRILDSTTDFFTNCKKVFIIPILNGIVMFWLISFWISLIHMLYTIGKMVPLQQIMFQARGVAIKEPFWLNGADWTLAFFACIVSMNFIKQHTRFMVSYLVVDYYFHENQNLIPNVSLRKAWSVASFHKLSIFWGSYFIPNVNFLRFFQLGRNEYQKKLNVDDNTPIWTRWWKVFKHHFDDVVDYVDYHYLAYMAISGDNFEESQKNSFILRLRWIQEYNQFVRIFKWFLFIVKVIAIIINQAFLEHFMRSQNDLQDYMRNTRTPKLMAIFFTYQVTSIFTCVLDQVVLALITCMSIDLELNDGFLEHGPPAILEAFNQIQEIMEFGEKALEKQTTYLGSKFSDEDDDGYDKVEEKEKEKKSKKSKKSKKDDDFVKDKSASKKSSKSKKDKKDKKEKIETVKDDEGNKIAVGKPVETKKSKKSKKSKIDVEDPEGKKASEKDDGYGSDPFGAELSAFEQRIAQVQDDEDGYSSRRGRVDKSEQVRAQTMNITDGSLGFTQQQKPRKASMQNHMDADFA